MIVSWYCGIAPATFREVMTPTDAICCARFPCREISSLIPSMIRLYTSDAVEASWYELSTSLLTATTPHCSVLIVAMSSRNFESAIFGAELRYAPLLSRYVSVSVQCQQPQTR